jgi:hypothetical protein
MRYPITCLAVLLVGGCSAADTLDTNDEPGAAGSSGHAESAGAGGASTGGSPSNVGSGGSNVVSSGGGGLGGVPGSAGSGGSNGGKGGMSGSGVTDGGKGGGAINVEAGVWTPPVCASGAPGAGLPAAAPVLAPGVWKAINPDVPTFTGKGGDDAFGQGFAIDPCNPATLYVAVSCFTASKGGLFRSTDAGSSWIRVGNLDEPLRIRIDPKDPLHMYVGDGVRGGTLGFWVTKDGGKTWAKPDGWKKVSADNNNMFIDDVYDVAVESSDFNHVLVTSHSTWAFPGSSGVLESKDGGNSWTVHRPTAQWGTGHGIWFISGTNTWLLGTQDNGYWRTSDSGTTWTQVSTQTMAHGGGQLYHAKNGALYVSSGNLVLRSTNEGVSWSNVGNVKFTTAIFGDGNFLYAHQAYGGGSDSFYTSPESDGQTWTAYQGGTQKFGNGPFEMAFDSANGILYSSNWGEGILALKVIRP